MTERQYLQSQHFDCLLDGAFCSTDLVLSVTDVFSEFDHAVIIFYIVINIVSKV